MKRLQVSYVIADTETTGLDYENDLPIEVGLVFCNRNWEIIDTYQAFVAWPEITGQDGWTKKQWQASIVHQIPFSEYRKLAKPTSVIVKEIMERTGQPPRKPVLISDNAVFDFTFLSKIFRREGKNLFDIFHYAVWDTNLFLSETGAGDPVPIHRALQDALLLYKAIIEARALLARNRNSKRPENETHTL